MGRVEIMLLGAVDGKKEECGRQTTQRTQQQMQVGENIHHFRAARSICTCFWSVSQDREAHHACTPHKLYIVSLEADSGASIVGKCAVPVSSSRS